MSCAPAGTPEKLPLPENMPFRSAKDEPSSFRGRRHGAVPVDGRSIREGLVFDNRRPMVDIPAFPPDKLARFFAADMLGRSSGKRLLRNLSGNGSFGSRRYLLRRIVAAHDDAVDGDTQLAEFVAERGPRDPQDPGGLQLVAAGAAEHP